MNTKKEKDAKIRHESNFEIVAKIVLILTIIGLIVSTALIFTPSISGEEYAELGLLTYNEKEEKFEADNYPTRVTYNLTSGETDNITLYIYISNHHRTVKYYEVRLKIGLQPIIVNENTSASSENSYFYREQWLQRIVDKNEKWGPSNATKVEFHFSQEIFDKLGFSQKGYKIIFELWEWNSNLQDFEYAGVVVYLAAFYVVTIT